MRYTTSTDVLVHQMAKGARHHDPLRHTALASESWQEPAGGPWVRCRAAFVLWRGDYWMAHEAWITTLPDNSRLAWDVCDALAMFEDGEAPARGYDRAVFIGLVRP